ncbi:YhcN/YlaJ family sporulation lipoprotein [Salimicrobium halophilum]|uniref:Sporulation lipoprotein YhcN/YlaJ (Spore_YhcN_YlaJ) n=1 Tax=Salimicrobium halophilum TaxID=86666 RepID=A0A1G8PKX8_9BACI|nr:YhcN/YlaJ family sporulation lipoprotein [Salimicrobium halophilum]SDI92996.1 Sporulation lipoprotein YhcN/YlaJ (Spore_YhcN_YlaJ) [Salimicrobium halophilum]
MKKYFTILVLLIIAGCGAEDGANPQDIDVSPTKQKTIEERKKNHTEKSSDNRFQNKEALAIAEEVNRMKEVATAQVFFSDDFVHVAVALNVRDVRDQDVADKVRAVVEPSTTLPVKVYTNRSYKERMDNLAERQRPGQIGHAIEQFFRSLGE